jgi:hypothetical protein
MKKARSVDGPLFFREGVTAYQVSIVEGVITMIDSIFLGKSSEKSQLLWNESRFG